MAPTSAGMPDWVRYEYLLRRTGTARSRNTHRRQQDHRDGLFEPAPVHRQGRERWPRGRRPQRGPGVAIRAACRRPCSCHASAGGRGRRGARAESASRRRPRRCPGRPPARCPRPRRRPDERPTAPGRRWRCRSRPRRAAGWPRARRSTEPARSAARRAARAGHAQACDQVHEPLGAFHRGGQCARAGWSARSGGSGPARLRCTAALHGRITSRRQIGEEQPGDAEPSASSQKTIEAVAQDRVEIAEDHDRPPAAAPRSISSRVPASVMPCWSAWKVERWIVGPVGERVAERHADLEDVGELVRRRGALPRSRAGRDSRRSGTGSARCGRARGAPRRPGEAGLRQSSRRP